MSDITYDPCADLTSALLQGQGSFKVVLKSVIREKLFPKVKFVKRECDLIFDTTSKTICGSILKWLYLCDKQSEIQYKFWSNHLFYVDKFLTQHRNNKIKKFKRQIKSKCY